MVTIEQKLSMFSKLLQRSMNENIAIEMEILKKDYEKKFLESKTAVDKEVQEIQKRAMKKAEGEKVEILSESALVLKKEYMATKAELFSLMLLHLQGEIEQFIQSEKYEAYLLMSVKKLEKANSFSDDVEIYMTKSDNAKYAEHIVMALPAAARDKVTFKIAEDKIIGGIILLNLIANTRIDLSIHSLLEEYNLYMVQTFFQAILE